MTPVWVVSDLGGSERSGLGGSLFRRRFDPGSHTVRSPAPDPLTVVTTAPLKEGGRPVPCPVGGTLAPSKMTPDTTSSTRASGGALRCVVQVL